MKEETSSTTISTKKLFVFFAVLGTAYFIVLAYLAISSASHIENKIDTLQAEITALAQKEVTPSPVNMEEAIVDAIKGMEARKQSELESKKYAKYKAAEETSGDKSIYGNLNARFTLVEFSDFECPFCKRFHDTPKQVVDGSGGNVNWEWKHLPLSHHNPVSQVQSLAAECVREQKGNRGFWVFLDEVFSTSAGGGKGVPNLATAIANVGANVEEAETCLTDRRYANRLKADLDLAVSNGITGTPATFIVDNLTGRKQLLAGAQPAAAFMAAISKMIAESDTESETGGKLVEQ